MAANDTNNDREGLAAEYALGTLEPGEKRDAERLMDADSQFRQTVWQWQNRLSPMVDATAPVEPPPGAFEDIMLKIGDQSPLAPPEQYEVKALNKVVRFWRGAAIAASMIIIALSATLVSREASRPSEPKQHLIAWLAGKDGKPAFVVSVDAKKQSVHVVRWTFAANQNKDFELWAINKGQPPRSLGVVNDGNDITASRFGLNKNMLQKAAFAISLEKKGGSTTGAPDIVLYSGKLYPMRKKK